MAPDTITQITPVGVALIGLSAGQSIDWIARDGRRRRMTVESVDGSVDGASRAVASRELRPSP